MSGKLLIQCELAVQTGMHIGGSSSFSAIGAVDSPVIRDTRTGRPIVPGSSLKGKLRTLLSRSICQDVEKMPDFDQDDSRILRMFGSAKPVRRARLQFADCFVSNYDEMSSVGLTEVKFENGINRMNSVANPRQIERVIAGTAFAVNLVYNVDQPREAMEDLSLLAKGFKLLQLDYLGGHGSRGSGRVSFRQFQVTPFETDLDPEAVRALFSEVESYELFPVSATV